MTASALTRAIVERDYLRVAYLAGLLRGRGVPVTRGTAARSRAR